MNLSFIKYDFQPRQYLCILDLLEAAAMEVLGVPIVYLTDPARVAGELAALAGVGVPAHGSSDGDAGEAADAGSGG